MTIEMMQNIAKGSITDVKKSPVKIFQKSEELKQGIYIINKNDVAGVMVTQEIYENLLNRLEELEEKIFEAEAARRIAMHEKKEKLETHPLDEVGIDLSNVEYNENDGWE